MHNEMHEQIVCNLDEENNHVTLCSVQATSTLLVSIVECLGTPDTNYVYCL